MFIQPLVGKYAHALPMEMAGWEPDANSTQCTPGQDTTEPEWMGSGEGTRLVSPLGSHWAQLTLAHSVGGVRVCVPPKHLVHTALAAALRESLLLCVHSSTVLQIWLHLFWAGLVTRLPKYGICTVCQSWDASRMTRGTAFVIFPLWAPREWPTTSRKKYLQCCSTWWATGMASDLTALQHGWQAHVSTETPALCTWLQFCCQMSFVLIFHIGQNNKARGPPMSYRKEKLINSRKSAL